MGLNFYEKGKSNQSLGELGLKNHCAHLKFEKNSNVLRVLNIFLSTPKSQILTLKN